MKEYWPRHRTDRGRQIERMDDILTAQQTVSDLWWSFQDDEVTLANQIMISDNKIDAYLQLGLTYKQGEQLLIGMRRKIVLYEAGQRGVLIR